MTSNGEDAIASPEDTALLEITPELVCMVVDVLEHCIQRTKKSGQHAPFEKEGVTVFNEHRNVVFRLESQPGVIFKTRIWEEAGALESDMQQRVVNTNRGRAVIARLSLTRLYLPKAQLFHAPLFDKPRAFIAEEELDIGHVESVLAEEFERLCHERDAAFLEAIEQLALFIIETGLSDIEHRNIPPLRREGAPFQLAIIDVEHMDSSTKGLAGDTTGRRGLLQCLTPDLARDTVAMLDAQNTPLDRAEIDRALDARTAEWERLQRLRLFYSQHGITSNAPIEVDMTSLEISEVDREAAALFVEILNAKLEAADPKETLTSQRQLYLSWYEIREHLLQFGGVNEARRRIPLFMHVLREAGVIFDVESLPPASFWIQV